MWLVYYLIQLLYLLNIIIKFLISYSDMNNIIII